MTTRIWPTVAIVFLVLLSLIPLFAFSVWRKSSEIDRRTQEARNAYRAADNAIVAIRSQIYDAEVLLENPATRVSDYAQKLERLQTNVERGLETLSGAFHGAQNSHLLALRGELHKFLNPATTSGRSVALLQITEQIYLLNQANLIQEEQQIGIERRALEHSAVTATGILLVLGVFIAAAGTTYLAKLESVSTREKVRAENAEFELRRLSNQLLRVQEEERKNFSRELHDQIGQMLTGLRMELAGLSPALDEAAFRERVSSAKTLAEESLRSVRNLALLLRPSMLDDLGLEAALRWQAKEFLRRNGAVVDVAVQGELGSLPEEHRICIYRAVQEALTNCEKYAGASRIAIEIQKDKDLVSASIRDDGRGFDTRRVNATGLGLVGMGERVRALQGQLIISSEPGKGTSVNLSLPLIASPA